MSTCVWRVSDCKNVSLCRETAREGLAEAVSCGSRELLQWMEKKDDLRG
jgi:hypothetical protein